MLGSEACAMRGFTAVAVVVLSMSRVAVDAQTTAAPQAPTALTAASATRSAVTLTWTAGAPSPARFIVERKGLGAPWPQAVPAPAGAARPPEAPPTPATIATATAATVTDNKVDAFATYVYRVRAIGSDDALSPPSNEVTVGPPPVGFTSVLAAPRAMQERDPSQFANQLRMVLDANGDPALVYSTVDLNNDGDPSDTELAFISWNRAKYRWNPPVHVDTVGEIPHSGSRIPFSVARDESTGRYGVLYQFQDHELRLSTSDDGGATWKMVSVKRTEPEEGTFATPSLVLAGGRIHLAYHLAQAGVRYRTGLTSDPPDTWTEMTAPPLGAASEARSEGVVVALDAGGEPAVTYWLNPSDGYTLTLAFWRPGRAPVKVLDTAGHQTDDPASHMVIGGAQVAIGVYANRDDQFFNNHHLWFVRSSDSGATWSAPVVVADDGGNAMGAPVTVSLDRAAHVAMAAEMSGGNGDGVKCGLPKLMRSADGARWTTCAPDTKGAPPTADVTFPTLAFAGNDKLYVAFKTRATVPSLPAGIVLWRER
jgi:hypothetical protein